MEAVDTASILEFLSLTDNRKIHPEGILAWHGLIGHLNFDVAREAAHLAKQDAQIDWVEPKHILAKARIIAERLETDARREKSLNRSAPSLGSPIPICDHGEKLVFCSPCCIALAENSKAK
jgi:hypothetical protein